MRRWSRILGQVEMDYHRLAVEQQPSTSSLVSFMMADRSKLRKTHGYVDDATLCRRGYAKLPVHEFLLAVDDSPQKFELLIGIARREATFQPMRADREGARGRASSDPTGIKTSVPSCPKVSLLHEFKGDFIDEEWAPSKLPKGRNRIVSL